eukprot:PhM_4_TR13677/c5_g1_i1/m.19405
MDGDAWSSHSTCDDTDAERPSCEAVRALPLKAALPEDAVWTIVRRGGAEERASCTNHAHTPSFAAHTAGGGTPSSRRAATAPHAASATMARRPVCTTLSRAATSAHCASHMLDTCGVIGAVALAASLADGFGACAEKGDSIGREFAISGEGEEPCRARVDIAVKLCESADGRCLGVDWPWPCVGGWVLGCEYDSAMLRLRGERGTKASRSLCGAWTVLTAKSALGLTRPAGGTGSCCAACGDEPSSVVRLSETRCSLEGLPLDAAAWPSLSSYSAVAVFVPRALLAWGVTPGEASSSEASSRRRTGLRCGAVGSSSTGGIVLRRGSSVAVASTERLGAALLMSLLLLLLTSERSRTRA